MDFSLQDMSDDSDFAKKPKESFRTVEERSNLAEIKVIIDHVPFCSYVFVIESGKPNSKVISWITNVIITSESNI